MIVKFWEYCETCFLSSLIQIRPLFQTWRNRMIILVAILLLEKPKFDLKSSNYEHLILIGRDLYTQNTDVGVDRSAAATNKLLPNLLWV
jgi:hypothetical protein